MISSILNVTFDCSDGELLARFWSGVTGWPWSKQEMPGNPFWLVGQAHDDRDRLVFVEVPEAKTVKNRVHLDLLVAEGSERDEVARLEAIGAKVLDDRRRTIPGGWVVMADPEGNEFCLEACTMTALAQQAHCRHTGSSSDDPVIMKRCPSP